MTRTLLLATCLVAIATPALTHAFQCGTEVFTYFEPRWSDPKEHYNKEDPDSGESHPLPSRLFKFTTKNGWFYRGKKCVELDDARFPLTREELMNALKPSKPPSDPVWHWPPSQSTPPSAAATADKAKR
jgi:hypothetical protein